MAARSSTRAAPRAASAWRSKSGAARLALLGHSRLDKTTQSANSPRHVSPAFRLHRLKRRAEFERVLGTGGNGVAARSQHFVLHHVSDAFGAAPGAATGQLSTGSSTTQGDAVDVSVASAGGVRAGAVIPKRWARRSVTRSLLKRQVFAAFERHLSLMPAGMWVVRLRSSFDTAQFPSAASQALRAAARSELDRLFEQAVRRRAQAPSSSVAH